MSDVCRAVDGQHTGGYASQTPDKQIASAGAKIRDLDGTVDG